MEASGPVITKGPSGQASPTFQRVDFREAAAVNATKATYPFCGKKGDTQRDCRKRKATLPKPPSACYGCGTPGIVKANCSKCRETNTISRVVMATFPSQIPEQANRQIFYIYIDNQRKRAIIDNGARRSVASSRVHKWLMHQGQTFHTSRMLIKLADGAAGYREMVLTKAQVVVKNLTFTYLPTTFMIFPDVQDSETLLEMDFMLTAGLLFNYKNGTWSFGSDPTTCYPIEYESNNRDVYCAGCI